MRVTVEIVPHGDEKRAELVQTVCIGQRERFDDDPGGLRGYAIWHTADYMRDPDATVMHWRSEGAAALATKALATLPRPEVRIG